MGPEDPLPGFAGGEAVQGPAPTTVVGAFVAQLAGRLTLQPGEKDLVVMQHDFEFEWPAEGHRREAHVSSLIAFGDDRGTAMAKTVGGASLAAAVKSRE